MRDLWHRSQLITRSRVSKQTNEFESIPTRVSSPAPVPHLAHKTRLRMLLDFHGARGTYLHQIQVLDIARQTN